MKINVQDQYASIRTQVISALLPNGFKVTDYKVEQSDNKVSLTIDMLDSSLHSMRKVTVVITDAHNETSLGYTRTFGISYNGAESVENVDSSEHHSKQIKGVLKHELNPSERCRYSAAQFIVSRPGLEYLDTVRQDIQHYCARLDTLAKAKQLLESAKSILKADKDQHGTLLAANTREQITTWIAKYRKLAEDKLASWVAKGDKLQKKPLADLRAQAVAVSLQAAAAPVPRASEQQLHALANRFAAMHVRAS
ncbi:MAG: hypothetical protein K2Y22_14345 [Candidatus Obscuribacterales bacterium]|nr:hypothetical protein [Candidatus Obscuribacterales bacterium]